MIPLLETGIFDHGGFITGLVVGRTGCSYSALADSSHFQGSLCRLRSEVNMAVGEDSFEIGKWKGKRHGLSMAIFNFQRMFLSSYDQVSLLLLDFWGHPVPCFFLKS